MVRLVGLEKQQCRRPVRLIAELGEKQRVAGGDDPVGHEEAGVAMVWMQAVPLPRVVTEDDVGPDPADGRGDLKALSNARLELAVGPPEERHVARAAERDRCGALLEAPSEHERSRVLLGIPRSLRPVRADEMEDLASARRPLRKRASASELDIVGVGCHGERPAGDREVRLHRQVAAGTRAKSSGRSMSMASRRSWTIRQGRPSRAASTLCRSKLPAP